MLKTIIDLLLIALIMALIHKSGFVVNIDDYINKKFPLHHLPFPLRCMLCSTFWLGILYLLITGNFTLIGVFIVLVMASLTNIFLPIFTLIENLLLHIIEILSDYLDERN